MKKMNSKDNFQFSLIEILKYSLLFLMFFPMSKQRVNYGDDVSFDLMID